jgi:Family of unknown function (DUF6288)
MLTRSRMFYLLGWNLLLAGLLSVSANVSAEDRESSAMPDFTRGDKIPPDARHDWNLGATRARGWISCDKFVTSDARQIAITQVEQGSPADGVLAVGDVLLGVGGQPFSYDPRTEFGKALTAAETEAGGGKLHLTRWRAGQTEEIAPSRSGFWNKGAGHSRPAWRTPSIPTRTRSPAP